MTRLLNYSTSIGVNRTLGEITGILVAHNAIGIETEYRQGELSAMSFRVTTAAGDLAFRLPARSASIKKIMEDDKLPGWSKPGQPQRVAWRIIKDWVEAQMALIDVGMVRLEEVFLPYAIAQNGQTFYELVVSKNFLLGTGKREESK